MVTYTVFFLLLLFLNKDNQEGKSAISKSLLLRPRTCIIPFTMYKNQAHLPGIILTQAKPSLKAESSHLYTKLYQLNYHLFH